MRHANTTGRRPSVYERAQPAPEPIIRRKLVDAGVEESGDRDRRE
jgi:hypothetical protein